MLESSTTSTKYYMLTAGRSVATKARSRKSLKLATAIAATGATIAGTMLLSAPASAASPVTITFLNTGASPQVLAYFDSTVIPGFEKANPGTSVQMSSVAWGASFTKIETGVVAGTADDVMLLGNIFLPVLASKHGLYPLTKFVKGWPMLKELNQPALHAGVWDNVQYALPANLDVRGLIYNEAMFKKAGITTPPTDWAEYKADAAKLVQKQGNRIVVEGADWAIDNSVGLAQTFNLLLTEAGGRLFNNGPNGTATFAGDSPAGERALNYLVSFYKDGLSSTSFIDIGSAPTPVALGEAAMEINNAGSFSEASPTIAQELRMTSPLSANPSGRPVGQEFVNKLAIYAKTKHPAQAWAFVRYLLQPSVVSRWDQLLGEAPPYPSLASTPPWNTGVFHAMVDDETYAKVFPVEVQSTAIDEILTRLVGNAIYGKSSVVETLAQMKSQIDPLLKG
jgi:multiple sugar transport system substrate-binding protein